MRFGPFLLFSSLSIATLYARQNEITLLEQEQQHPQETQEDGLFLRGGLEMFNKTAFSTKQALPNNSYGYVLGELSVGYQYQNWQFMVGAVAAGLTHDSTKGEAYSYVGAYPGYLNDKEATADNTHNMFVHNAFAQYQSDSLNIKIGRFEQENDEWFDSYAEGVNAVYNITDSVHIKLFGASSVALVGSGWLNDFSMVYSTYGIVNAEVGYQNDFLNAKAYVYYGALEYVAPGLSAEVVFGDKERVQSRTKLVALFPIHTEKITELDNYFFSGFAKNGDPTGFTSSLLVRQDITLFDTYNIGLGIYKNFGNANARMGVFGNPIGIDVWDNSVYAYGNALNAAVAPDAFNALFFSEARYENLARYVQAISIGLDGRYTTAPSANEYSVKLVFDWQIIDSVSVGLIANYYTHIMKDSAWNASDIVLTGDKNVLDRSYLMTSVTYAF